MSGGSEGEVQDKNTRKEVRKESSWIAETATFAYDTDTPPPEPFKAVRKSKGEDKDR